MMSSALFGVGALLCLAMMALMCLPMAVGMLRRHLHHNAPAASTGPEGHRQPAPDRN
jgi:hypothetical protein